VHRTVAESFYFATATATTVGMSPTQPSQTPTLRNTGFPT
jgi:hypothetical protein